MNALSQRYTVETKGIVVDFRTNGGALRTGRIERVKADRHGICYMVRCGDGVHKVRDTDIRQLDHITKH